MPTDTVYHQSSAIIIMVMNAVSFLSLGFVLAIYIVRWKRIISFPLRLSFYLCIACIVQNLYVLMYNPILVNNSQANQGLDSSPFCIFESILKVASDLSSIVWTTLIIYSSFASIVLKKNLQQAQISYLIFGFLFCTLLAIIPVFFKLYGFNTYYCWFGSEDMRVEFALKMGYYYVPLWVGFFLTVFMSVKVYKTLKQLGLQKKQLVFFKRLMLFPLIMLGTAFFPTINIIYNFIANDYPQWLDDFSSIATGLYGVLNSIAYGFNPIIREQMLIVLKIRKEESKEEVEMSDIATIYGRNTSRLSDLFR